MMSDKTKTGFNSIIGWQTGPHTAFRFESNKFHFSKSMFELLASTEMKKPTHVGAKLWNTLPEEMNKG